MCFICFVLKLKTDELVQEFEIVKLIFAMDYIEYEIEKGRIQ